MSRGPRVLADVLSELFARRGYAQVEADDQMQTTWSEVAGAEVAAASRVVGLRSGCLEIIVQSSVLLHELAMFRQAELLTALQQRLPQSRLKRLKFRTGAVV